MVQQPNPLNNLGADLFLALDCGSGSSRGVVWDGGGNIWASATVPLATRHPKPGWVEHDPLEVEGSLRQVLALTAEQLGPQAGRVVSVGLATARSNCLCWQAPAGTPLTPIYSWQDTRAADQLAPLAPYAESIRQKTGLRLSAHYGASKLAWALGHVLEVGRAQAAGTLGFGPMAAWLAGRLTGEANAASPDSTSHYIADPQNASRTLLWNLHTMTWDQDLLAWFGLPGECLPRAAATLGDWGAVPWAGGKAGGRVPLRVVQGDQAAALYGFGRPDPEAVYVNLGTGAFIQRVMETRRGEKTGSAKLPGEDSASGLLESMVWAGAGTVTLALEGTVNGCGAALAWLGEKLRAKGEARPVETLAALGLAAWDAEPTDGTRENMGGEMTNGLVFLNGVSGLAAPYWRPGFQSRFVGGGVITEPSLPNMPPEHAAAVAESIVFLLMENFRRMEFALPPARRMWVGGGVSALDGLCQRLADLSGLPVGRRDDPEATARGLAWLLARDAGGRDPEWPAPPPDLFTPRRNPALEGRYRLWQAAMARALAS
ncbi:MAG: FGGY family carbohydrate kinase [Deltaproteobacteria bacterium]|nr:FGGY family carbohydrate kinase [Deltaproteobacteria bacterium]